MMAPPKEYISGTFDMNVLSSGTFTASKLGKLSTKSRMGMSLPR